MKIENLTNEFYRLIIIRFLGGLYDTIENEYRNTTTSKIAEDVFFSIESRVHFSQIAELDVSKIYEKEKIK